MVMVMEMEMEMAEMEMIHGCSRDHSAQTSPEESCGELIGVSRVAVIVVEAQVTEEPAVNHHNPPLSQDDCDGRLP